MTMAYTCEGCKHLTTSNGGGTTWWYECKKLNKPVDWFKRPDNCPREVKSGEERKENDNG